MNYRFETAALASAALLFLAAGPLCAKDSKESVKELHYVLPQTSITVSVSADITVVSPGKYAPWAKELLGEDVPLQDKSTVSFDKITIHGNVEPDLSRWYSVRITDVVPSEYENLSKSGLIIGAGGSIWKSAVKSGGKYFDSSVPARPVSKKQNLQREAESAAQQILKIRAARYAIIVGDTDATYSGEALGAAIDALQQMEDKLISDFRGNVTTLRRESSFTVVPSANVKKQRLPLFNLCGTEYFLDVEKPEVAALDNETPDIPAITYRIPACCSLTVTDGTQIICQGRQIIYQLGAANRLPVLSRQ